MLAATMQLAEWFAEERGRCVALAGKLGVTPAFLSQIATRRRPAPPAHVPMIEAESGFKVRRWELRPEDWHAIWPELKGTEGAPEPRREAVSDAA